MPELKLFVEDYLSVDEMIEFLFDRVENIEGNGENAGNKHFFFFPRMFLKGLFCRVNKISCGLCGKRNECLSKEREKG